MVESSESGQIGIIVGNPTTTRGRRVSWAFNKQGSFLVYAVKNNFIFRNELSAKTHVFTENKEIITAVSVQPDGQRYAFGDESGKVVILTLKSDGEFMIDKEWQGMLGGAVNAIVWTNDGQRLIAVGDGRDNFAVGVLVSSGTKIGEILGANKNLLCADISPRPFHLFSAGEGSDILDHKGVPFKGQGLAVPNPHGHFVNQIRLSPNASHLVTASSDKSIAVFETGSREMQMRIEGAHSKGIYDVAWIDDDNLVTCSADNTVKVWNVESDDTKEPTRVLHQLEDAKEEVARQALGVLYRPVDESIWAVNLDSDVHRFAKDGVLPAQTYQGHKEFIGAQLTWDKWVIYASEHNVFYARIVDGAQFVGKIKGLSHTQPIDNLVANETAIFTAGFDKVVARLAYVDGVPAQTHTITFEGKPISVHADDEVLTVLLHTGDVILLSATDLSQISAYKAADNSTAISRTKDSKQLWIGDKKGKLSVYNENDFSLVQEEQKHTREITVIAISQDGARVATADSYRIINVWNTADISVEKEHGYHKDRILSLQFSGDLLVSSSGDRSFAVLDLTTHQIRKQVKFAHEKKAIHCANINADQTTIYTYGDDCAIRVWSL